MLEIYDCISQYKEHIANLEGVKAIIKNPKLPFINNPDSISNVRASIKSFHSSFLEYFKKEEIILRNKDADSVLESFHLFHKGENEELFDKQEFEVKDGKFFEIDEFGDENLLKNALFGFSSSKKEYDLGLYFDSSKGLFIVPFLGSLNFFLKSKGENELSKEALGCVKYFVLSNKVTPELLMKKQLEYPCFLECINMALSKEFNSMEDVIKTYKEDFLDSFVFSPINVLFESDVFSKLIGYREETESKTVGRNDLCPCGSGKKYKKCCLLKKGA